MEILKFRAVEVTMSVTALAQAKMKPGYCLLGPRFSSNPIRIRVPLFLLFCFDKGTPKQK